MDLVSAKIIFDVITGVINERTRKVKSVPPLNPAQPPAPNQQTQPGGFGLPGQETQPVDNVTQSSFSVDQQSLIDQQQNQINANALKQPAPTQKTADQQPPGGIDLYDLNGEKAAAERLKADDGFKAKQIEEKAAQTKEFFAEQDRKQEESFKDINQKADRQLQEKADKEFWDQKQSQEMQAGMDKELLSLHEAARQEHQAWRSDFTQGICRDDVAALYNKDISDRVGAYKDRLDDVGANPVDASEKVAKYQVKLSDEVAPEIEQKAADLQQEHFPEYLPGAKNGPSPETPHHEPDHQDPQHQDAPHAHSSQPETPKSSSPDGGESQAQKRTGPGITYPQDGPNYDVNGPGGREAIRPAPAPSPAWGQGGDNGGGSNGGSDGGNNGNSGNGNESASSKQDIPDELKPIHKVDVNEGRLIEERETEEVPGEPELAKQFEENMIEEHENIKEGLEHKADGHDGPPHSDPPDSPVHSHPPDLPKWVPPGDLSCEPPQAVVLDSRGAEHHSAVDGVAELPPQTDYFGAAIIAGIGAYAAWKGPRQREHEPDFASHEPGGSESTPSNMPERTGGDPPELKPEVVTTATYEVSSSFGPGSQNADLASLYEQRWKDLHPNASEGETNKAVSDFTASANQIDQQQGLLTGPPKQELLTGPPEQVLLASPDKMSPLPPQPPLSNTAPAVIPEAPPAPPQPAPQQPVPPAPGMSL